MIGSWDMWKETGKIALPSAAEMMLVSIVASVDTVMVGRLGKEALSIVGLSGQPRMLLLCIFFALNTGVTATVARLAGEGKREAAERTMSNMIVIAGVAGIVLATVGCCFSGSILRLAGGRNGSASTIEEAAAYFRITVCSLPLQGITMCICASLRGRGNAKATLLVNLISAGVHAVLSFLLIYGKVGLPAMGVYGAGWAMNAGILTGFLASLMILARKKYDVRFSLKKAICIKWEDVLPVMKVSGNAAVEQLGMRVGYFVYGRILFGAGVTLYAANQVCQQLASITFAAGDGLGAAGTALVSRSRSERRSKAAYTYSWMCLTMATILAAIMCAVIWMTRNGIANIFIGEGTWDAVTVKAYAAQGLGALAIMQIFQIAAVTSAGCLRGNGDNVFVAVVATLCAGVVRPVLTYLAVRVWQMELAWIWVISMAEMVVRLCCFLPRIGNIKTHITP